MTSRCTRPGPVRATWHLAGGVFRYTNSAQTRGAGQTRHAETAKTTRAPLRSSRPDSSSQSELLRARRAPLAEKQVEITQSSLDFKLGIPWHVTSGSWDDNFRRPSVIPCVFDVSFEDCLEHDVKLMRSSETVTSVTGKYDDGESGVAGKLRAAAR